MSSETAEGSRQESNREGGEMEVFRSQLLRDHPDILAGLENEDEEMRIIQAHEGSR